MLSSVRLKSEADTCNWDTSKAEEGVQWTCGREDDIPRMPQRSPAQHSMVGGLGGEAGTGPTQYGNRGCPSVFSVAVT